MRNLIRFQLSVSCLLTCAALGASDLPAQQGAGRVDSTATPKTETVAPKVPEVDKIVTPASPAFVVLGIAPSTIERPSTPSKIALSLSNAFVSGNQAKLPAGYALEVAPFWLYRHPRLRVNMLEDQFGSRNPSFGSLASRVGQNLLHTLVLGVATADSAFSTGGAQPKDTSVFRLGFGARASLLRGRWHDECLKSIEKPLADIADRIAVPLAEWLKDNPNPTPLELDRKRQSLEVSASAAPKADTLSVKDPGGTCLSSYYGVSLDLAAAAVERFPAQSFDDGQLSSHAVWVTLGYKDKRSRSLLAVLRVGKEGAAGKRLGSTYTDIGSRVVLPNADWAFSVEAVHRRLAAAGSTSNLWRVTGGFDYKVNDGVWINSSFGRDYLAVKQNSLIAQLGLKWNLGTKSLVAEEAK